MTNNTAIVLGTHAVGAGVVAVFGVKRRDEREKGERDDYK